MQAGDAKFPPSRERRRSGQEWRTFNFRSFPIMPVVDGGGGWLELRLGLHPHPNLLPSREKGPEPSRERRGGVDPGPIWPCLASFTPSGETENEATLASFGTPPTPTHCASWPWLASSGVPRSGETFNSVAFGCISLLFLSSTRGRDASFPRKAGMTKTNVAVSGAMP